MASGHFMLSKMTTLGYSAKVINSKVAEYCGGCEDLLEFGNMHKYVSIPKGTKKPMFVMWYSHYKIREKIRDGVNDFSGTFQMYIFFSFGKQIYTTQKSDSLSHY